MTVTGPACPSDDRVDAWARAWPWWHAAFAVAAIVTAAVTIVGPGSRGERGLALVLLAAIVAAYASIGRRVIGPVGRDVVALALAYGVLVTVPYAGCCS